MTYKKLPYSFYRRSTFVVAKELLGKILVRKIGGKVISGIIVETEAYPGRNDPASHSYIGKTHRTSVMFEEGGKGYVYFTYGAHFCFNVVTGVKDKGSAVLIRALEPLEGIDIMKKNRGTDNTRNLTNGPGKLAQALSIDKALNGCDLRGNELFAAMPADKKKHSIIRTKRIGISKNTEKLYRYYIKDNSFVSGRKI